MAYSVAILQVPRSEQQLVLQQLSWWRLDPDWNQIAQNIENETALPMAALVTLLTDFGRSIAAGALPNDAWILVCRGQQFLGAVMNSPDRPLVIGRALPIKQYAKFISDSSGLTELEAERMLRDLTLGAIPQPSDERILRRAPIGGVVVWATFSSGSPNRNPFDFLVHTTEDICTALGLGGATFGWTETLVLLAYGTTISGTALPLHRPTIAEAADYAWYRPHSDPNLPYGWTQPLPPNRGGHARQPEIVHRKISGDSLIFPIALTR